MLGLKFENCEGLCMIIARSGCETTSNHSHLQDQRGWMDGLVLGSNPVHRLGTVSKYIRWLTHGRWAGGWIVRLQETMNTCLYLGSRCSAYRAVRTCLYFPQTPVQCIVMLGPSILDAMRKAIRLGRLVCIGEQAHTHTHTHTLYDLTRMSL